MKHPLANDANGNPIDVPERAAAWRLRRGGGRRGRPRNVYDPDTGRQLERPLNITIDDLIDLGLSAGRYRLEAIDADGLLIPGVVAFTEISPEAIADAAEDDEPDDNAGERAHSDQLLETVKSQSQTLCEVVKSLAHGFNPVSAPMPVYMPAPSGKEDAAGANNQLAQLGQIIDQAVKAWAMFQQVKGAGAAAAAAAGGAP
jgi:hypothetical protein